MPRAGDVVVTEFPGATGAGVMPGVMRSSPAIASCGSVVVLQDLTSSLPDQLESELIRSALERYHWNKTKAAEHLGLKRTTLQYKIKKYGLE